jgi:hypothetical protein
LKRRGNIILIDPHGDLAKEVLNLVDDKTRLVYIDPLLSNLKTPTFNLFEITNKTEESINQNTQLILTILKNINDDNPFSSAMEYVAKYSISFMIRSGNGSFSELKRLMIDVKNSDLLKAARNSPNLSEAEFFRYEFKDLKKVREALKYRIAKLEKGSFQNLMNGTNTIDLKKLMNAKDNIIIFNVPKGDMPDTYEAYVQFLLCYIQIIALKRVGLLPKAIPFAILGEFYFSLNTVFKSMLEEGFLEESAFDYFSFFNEPKQAVEFCKKNLN